MFGDTYLLLELLNISVILLVPLLIAVGQTWRRGGAAYGVA